MMGRRQEASSSMVARRGRMRLAACRGAVVALLAMLGGCGVLREFQPSVSIQPMTAKEYIALQRGDILTSGKLSGLTAQTIRVTGLDQEACADTITHTCIDAVRQVPGISDERRMSALSELWLQMAMSTAEGGYGEGMNGPGGLTPWMEAARHAYAYLFFTPRTPGERAFEDRQTQVRDWYNYTVQEAVARMFAGHRGQSASAGNAMTRFKLDDWVLQVRLAVRLPEGVEMVKELVPASSLAFQGLRGVYRRDGFGAELVAVMDALPVASSLTSLQTGEAAALWDEAGAEGASRLQGLAPAGAQATRGRAGDSRAQRRVRLGAPVPAVTPDTAPDTANTAQAGAQGRYANAWSEMPSPNITVVFRYAGTTLDEVLATHEVDISVHDPLVERELSFNGQHVPLAGNFTAGYGLWLARSGFSRQSLRNLFGREDGIDRPHLYMMQPYDPDRRILLMLHGLASSPEAWVNVANEIIGDEALRSEFQVWQVYYPTNLPLIFNHAAIRRLLERTLQHFDPEGTATASSGLVLVGHSMGGMISRMMISSADEQLWDWALKEHPMEPARLERLRPKVERMLRFQPFPGVERAVFIAAPHRGTPVAAHRLVRWIASFIRLPLTILENFDDALQARASNGTLAGSGPAGMPTSIDNLNEQDTFVRAAAALPLSNTVRYHSIIGRQQAEGPLEETDDGVVPYRSAHLPGAVSEKVIVSGHSVQETAAAILELRRILHEDIQAREAGHGVPVRTPLPVQESQAEAAHVNPASTGPAMAVPAFAPESASEVIHIRLGPDSP